MISEGNTHVTHPDDRHRSRLDRPDSLVDVGAADFDAVVIAGGHGPMVDLARVAEARAVLAANDLGQIIAPALGPSG